MLCGSMAKRISNSDIIGEAGVALMRLRLSEMGPLHECGAPPLTGRGRSFRSHDGHWTSSTRASSRANADGADASVMGGPTAGRMDQSPVVPAGRGRRAPAEVL